MDRKRTNFTSDVAKYLEKAFESSTYKDKLKYYQILTTSYFTSNTSKGLYIWHHMGMGKTLNTYHIMFENMKIDKSYSKYTIIAPRALQENFKKSARTYTDIVGEKVDMGKVYFVKYSHTTEKQIARSTTDEVNDPFNMDKKSDNLASKVKNLDGYCVILEEAHLFLRRLSHGSEYAIRLYDLIMKSKCRLIMLSGSLAASSPFEIAIAMNMLSGELLFPEDDESFMEIFYDSSENSIKNRAIFQNRCFGLVSRMKPEYLGSADEKLFPTKLETQVVKVPMDRAQLTTYLAVREKEVKDSAEMKNRKDRGTRVNRFQSSAGKVGSYRVRSRQSSNFPPNHVISEMYKKKEYTQAMLIDEINKMKKGDPYLKSPKAAFLIDLINKRKNQKGVIYSQFIAAGGAANISACLRIEGMNEITASTIRNKKVTRDKNSKGNFALINGNLTEEEQDEIVKYYNDEENDHGENLALIIIGHEQCMGLDLKSVRYEVMFEPYWVYYLADQFEYRANRYMSHMRLPEKERNYQIFILLSVYPKNLDMSKLSDQMKETTDEYIYGLMIKNRDLLKSFKEAVEEVSIECNIISKFNVNTKHLCKSCIPDDESLYTAANYQLNPYHAIKYDIQKGDPCRSGEKEKVVAKKITLNTDGNKVDYFYISSDANMYGYQVFIKVGDGYEEVPYDSDVFKKIIEKLS